MTIITVPGMLPNPIIPREYYQNLLLDKEITDKLSINGAKEEEEILGIVSSVSVNNSISVLTIGNKSVDAYLKLTGKISEISARFDIVNEDNMTNWEVIESRLKGQKEEYIIWNKLNQFLRLAARVDVSGLSNKFVMFRGQKINKLVEDIKNLMVLGKEITDNTDELRHMIIEAQNDIIDLENKLEEASYDVELSRKAMILVSIASQRYIEDNVFDDVFKASVKRNINSVEARISGINSTLISKVTTFMSLSDLKRNISVHAYTIDRAIGVFIPSWIKIAEDVNKAIKEKKSLVEYEKENKEAGIFSRVGQLVIDMKNKDDKNNTKLKKEVDSLDKEAIAGPHDEEDFDSLIEELEWDNFGAEKEEKGKRSLDEETKKTYGIDDEVVNDLDAYTKNKKSKNEKVKN